MKPAVIAMSRSTEMLGVVQNDKARLVSGLQRDCHWFCSL